MSYDYNSWEPIKIRVEDLSPKERYWLEESDTFCIYPWIHLHTYPTGQTYPCCHADMQYPVGDAHEDTLETIWHNDEMKRLRARMVCGVKSDACKRCYEQEANGFFSGRRSANKHHGHHIKKVRPDSEAVHADFEMTYWDIRFSNLCNLSCRTCGHIFSSSWYNDQVALAGPEWKKQNKALNIAGRFEGDMLEQVLKHIDHVEQIYFAGGEPLTMEEHYVILEELVRRKKYDVRLIYNTNFTRTYYKGKDIFEYWRHFNSVSVGASLDGMGSHAEYIRKGTTWDIIEENRKRMMSICPNVDFYISPTVSIFNAIHVVDFHRNWVEKGFIRAQDLNINILQDPAHYRIDIAPEHYKQLIRFAYHDHLYWLDRYDTLQRASNGIRSALNFLNANDNSHLLNKFWEKTVQLDSIRNESIFDYIPEMEWLRSK